MNTHTNPNALTEKELTKEIHELEQMAERGEITSIHANRLRELKLAKKNIRDAVRTQWI